MRNRVLLAAGSVAAILPSLLFAQQRPAQQPQRPAQRPAAQPQQRPAQQPAARPAMPAAAGTAEQQGAWHFSIAATGFAAKDKALYAVLSGVAGNGDHPNYFPGAIASLAYNLSDNFSLGVGGGFGSGTGLTLLGGTADATYSFSPAEKLSPYLGVSVGGSRWSGSGPASKASGLGGYGRLGVRMFVSDNLALFVEGRAGMENYSGESVSAIVGSGGVGLSFFFGGKKIVTTIVVAPATGTLTALRATQSLSATAKDQKGRPMTGEMFTWRSSNPAVATVSPSGVVTAVGNGTATISAADAGITGSAMVTVGQTANTVAVMPATGSLNAVGATQSFSASARDAGNNPMAGARFTWTSSNPSVASVDANGTVTAAGNGTATITASSGGKNATASVTVAQATAAVAVTPATSSLTAAGATAQLAARATDGNGNAITGKTFTWASDAPAVATVNPTGLVTGVANGVAHVSASVDGKSGSATVTLIVAARGAPPVELPAVGASKVIANIAFRTVAGRPTLLPAATSELDKYAIAIQGAPNSRWEIGGYTSNVGRAPALTLRSQREADAVKAYLVSKGVSAGSITAVGYGSARPVGNNRTAAGRRQNNRTEIKRVQ